MIGNTILSPVAESIPFDGILAMFGPGSVADALIELRRTQKFLSQTTATTLNGVLTLTAASSALQFLTGSATGFSIQLPSALTLDVSTLHILINTTSQTMLVKDGAGNTLFTLSQNSVAYCFLQTKTTAAGGWIYYQILASSTASGIINYTVKTSAAFAVTTPQFPTFSQITGFQITPQAGTYVCMYNASVLHTTTPIAHYWSFFLAGNEQTASRRQQDTAHSNQVMVDSLLDVLTFNGSQQLDVRVAPGTSGTLTVNSRTLALIRLGN